MIVSDNQLVFMMVITSHCLLTAMGDPRIVQVSQKDIMNVLEY